MYLYFTPDGLFLFQHHSHIFGNPCSQVGWNVVFKKTFQCELSFFLQGGNLIPGFLSGQVVQLL